MRHNRTSIINTPMRVGAQGVTAAFQIRLQLRQRPPLRPAVAYCLSLHPWSFALKHAALARGTESPAPGWRYAWPLPADCLRVVNAVADGGERHVRYALSVMPCRRTAVPSPSASVPRPPLSRLRRCPGLARGPEIAPCVEQGGAARPRLSGNVRARPGPGVWWKMTSGSGPNASGPVLLPQRTDVVF